MSSKGFPSRFAFLSGAHMDQVIHLDKEAVPGASNPATISISPGGAALNSASIAAILGLKSVLASPVGNDIHGDLLRSVLQQRGIEDALTVEDNGSTGIYSAIFNTDGNLVIGAADLSIYDRIDAAWLSRHLHPLANQNVGLFLTSNLSHDLLETACKGFDMIAAVTISPAKSIRLRPIIDRLNLLFTNRREAATLLDMPNADSKTLAEELVKKGVGSGTISDGGQKLVAWADEEIMEFMPHSQPHIVDVNGAGDALAGACLAALAQGNTMKQSVPYAMKIATSTLSHNGPYPPHPKTLPKPETR